MIKDIEHLMEDGCWSEALEASKDLVERLPAIPEGHAYLGYCHEHFNRLPEAAESLKKAFILKPRFWQAGLRLAECLDRLGRYEEALGVAELTLKERPSDEYIIGLIRGLKRQVPEKITEGWQVSKKQGWWMIDLKDPEDS